ncbi:MAG: oligopeptide transporter, OPT family [Acidobacteriaceae bacterium]|nr:oligopeptide transporter, OPT family [Acidobacteriaceae bacterium]MBV9778463.1 oligopeptide transporter, OPT family [Acidobacteriaceae bacterium]
MSTQARPFKPFVPEHLEMRELTKRAVLLGLCMTVILGAANAYLGLRAGITIAATYPAAVISMAVLRAWRGSLLEENIARTSGSIGEGVAAGAIFTIPAFLISHAWASLGFREAYWKSTMLIIVGSVLGVLFISLVRRVMVEDPELPFPESVAASEIHKAGQRGAEAAKYLFWSMGLGGLIFLLGRFGFFAADSEFAVRVGRLGSTRVRLGGAGTNNILNTGGISTFSAPSVSPAYLGVGYVIGVRLAALQFSGSVLAWGLMVPVLIYFLGPQLQNFLPAGAAGGSWSDVAGSVWRYIVRPIAVGGMLVGAGYTLFRMRTSLASGLKRGIADIRQTAEEKAGLSRTERYMSSKVVFGLIGLVFVVMLGLYVHLSGEVVGGVVAAVVMLIMGFFFATVSGSLVGIIGSSNNPISGLTISTLIIAAVLMVALGIAGTGGVAAVLGVAAVVCVSSAVAGELLQDFKVGYILGGTPRNIQVAELIAVLVASLVMYFPLVLLHEGNIKAGGTGFGDRQLPAPQAGLMALLAQGIVGGDMPWALVLVGIFMGFALIMMQVKSPMLVSVGMYLPFETTAAIFVGGLIRWMGDRWAERRGYNEAQRARVENAGVLTASGLIAGEAILGLVWAGLQFTPPNIREHLQLLAHPSYFVGLAVLGILAFIMIRSPMTSAGSPDEPAPPVAMM